MRGAAHCPGELPGAQPTAERGAASLALSPSPGSLWALTPAYGASPHPTHRRGSGRFGCPGGGGQGARLGSLLPAPGRRQWGKGVSKGCDARRAGDKCAAGLRGKFSSFAWRAHVYVCEGLDPGQQAALRCWRLASEGSFFSLAPRGRLSASAPQPWTQPHAEGVAPSPDPKPPNEVSLLPLLQPPGWLGVLDSTP